MLFRGLAVACMCGCFLYKCLGCHMPMLLTCVAILSPRAPCQSDLPLGMSCFPSWLQDLVPCLPRQTERTANRWVFITGCDSGFGRLLVSQALGAGFSVVAACLGEEGRKALDLHFSADCQAKRLRAGRFTSVVADLTTAHGILAVVAAVQVAVQQERQELWAIVNNAGVCLPGNVEWADPATYEKTFSVNFFAPVKLTYELLPLLKQSKGRVVNVTSVDGFIALPTNAAYNASKHALESYSDTLRCEMLPWGVKVVVVEPTTMRTPLAMAYADSFLAGFKASPPERRAPYGDAWAEELAARTKVKLDAAAEDPQITVDALLQALLMPEPPTRMVTGAGAHKSYKPLSKLPDGARDAKLYELIFLGLKPAGLS